MPQFFSCLWSASLLSWEKPKAGGGAGGGLEGWKPGYLRGHILPLNTANVPVTLDLITQKRIVQWHNVGYLKDVCSTKVPVLTCRLRNGFLNHLISVANEKLWKVPVN